MQSVNKYHYERCHNVDADFYSQRLLPENYHFASRRAHDKWYDETKIVPIDFQSSSGADTVASQPHNPDPMGSAHVHVQQSHELTRFASSQAVRGGLLPTSPTLPKHEPEPISTLTTVAVEAPGTACRPATFWVRAFNCGYVSTNSTLILPHHPPF